jgi:hypothetical protein
MADSMLTTSQTSASSHCTLHKACTRGVCETKKSCRGVLAKATRAEAAERQAREREKNLARQRLDRERRWAKSCWY